MTKTGLGRNDFGPLLFILFWVQNPLNPAEPFATWEYFLNPKDDQMVRRLRKLAAQTHWHLTLVGEAGRQENYFEFENHYCLAEALDFAEEATSNVGMVDFTRAKDAFMQKYTVDDLFRSGISQEVAPAPSFLFQTISPPTPPR